MQDISEGQSEEICVEIDSGSTEREILISVNTEDGSAQGVYIITLQKHLHNNTKIVLCI